MQDEASGLNTAPKISFFLLIVVTLLAALNLTYLWLQTSNPDETSNPESLFVLHSVEVSEGKPLYTDFRKPPYNVTQYTPVHYFVLAFVKRTFDLNMQQLFVWGRRLMLLLASCIGLAIFLHGKKQTQSMIYSLTAALIFVGSYMLWPLACTNRADIPATLFSIIAIVIFAQNAKYSLYLSIPFLLLAFYTKHSFLSAPAAIGLYLLMNRQLVSAINEYVEPGGHKHRTDEIPKCSFSDERLSSNGSTSTYFEFLRLQPSMAKQSYCNLFIYVITFGNFCYR